MIEHWLSMIRREVERTMRKLIKTPRIGLVVNYDPKRFAVKVQLQPEGTITGWIPLTAVAIGNQFGVLHAPNIKDQVEVHFGEGDQLAARVMTRHFSKVDVAPELQAGEYAQIHQTGSQIRQSADGTVRIAGAGDVSTGTVGGGKSGNTGTGNQGQTSGQDATQQQPSKTQAKNFITLTPDGKITIDAQNNDITVQADNSNIYLVNPAAPQKATKAVTNVSASVVAVQLVNGAAAKSLYAEPA